VPERLPHEVGSGEGINHGKPSSTNVERLFRTSSRHCTMPALQILLSINCDSLLYLFFLGLVEILHKSEFL
jgi:hypothetical protein